MVSGAHVVGVVSAADLLDLAASARGLPRPIDEASPAEMNDGSSDDEIGREDAPATSYFAELWSTASDAVTERVNNPESIGTDLLDEHTVDEIMSRPLVALSPNDDVLSAAEVMRRQSIHRVIVVQNGTLVGIVSALDIVRAVADHKLVTRTYVFDRTRSAPDRELEA